MWDKFPVTAGHALIVPYRHCDTWFDASAAEQSELMSAVEAVCDRISRDFRPIAGRGRLARITPICHPKNRKATANR